MSDRVSDVDVVLCMFCHGNDGPLSGNRHETEGKPKKLRGHDRPAKIDSNLTAQLSIYTDLSLSDEWFKIYVIEPVQVKVPNVNLELVRSQICNRFHA